MEDYGELDSRECLTEEEIKKLCLIASKFLYPHFGGSLAITIVPGLELKMNVSHFDHSYITINFYEAYIKFIYDGLYLILSDNSIYKEIGKSSHLMNIPSFDYNFPKCYNDFNFDLIEAGKAKFDEDRRILHTFLFQTTIKLLVLHECNHVLNGHTGFLKANGIKEGIDPISIGLLTSLDLHTLEMDADCISILSLLNTLVSSKNELKIPEAIKSNEGIIEAILFSLFFLFFVLPRQKFSSIKEIQNSSHPSNGLRFGLMISTLATSGISDGNDELINAIKNVTPVLIQKFTTSFKNISGEDIDLRELELFLTEEGRIYFAEVTNNWNFLRHKIAPFAYKKLASYTKDFMDEIRLDYQSFVLTIESICFSYSSMLYSNSYLYYNLLPKNKLESFSIAATINGDGVLKLDFKELINTIESRSKQLNIDYSAACQNAIMFNAHFLRTKVISEVYTIITEYFDNHQLLAELHSLNWFRILYILNQSLNNKTISFPKSEFYTPSIHWKEIYINDGQLSKTIRYNDKEILDLLIMVKEYFITNQEKYNIDKNKWSNNPQE